MAESDVHSHQIRGEIEQGKQQKGLRYLVFVDMAAVHALMYISRLYGLAKEKSGPLKPGVETVEGTVRTVFGPIYDKYHGLPFEILEFVDRKVGDTFGEVDRHVPSAVKHIPSAVKQASTQAYTVAQKAPEVARSISSELHRTGVINAAAVLARAALNKAEPVAGQCAVSVWRSLNRLPVFHQVAQTMVPTAAHWTEKYNQAVSSSAEKGYALAEYMPLVPMERIAEVFGENEEVMVATA